MANVLVIGGGGRESAILRALLASQKVSHKIFVHPGNQGISMLTRTERFLPDGSSQSDIVRKCVEEKIDLVVIGPEKYLEEGLVDKLKEAGIDALGPESDSAKLETSKALAKDFMKRYSIPTADFEIFEDIDTAITFLDERCEWDGIAVKASGICGGKGVFVCNDKNEAKEELEKIKESTGALKEATKTIVLEEKLLGYEVSVQVILDKKGNHLILPISQDHKKRFSGDSGPNTGGMGAVCPITFLSEEENLKIQDIIKKTVHGLCNEQKAYAGILYIGLMVGKTVNVLEYNCRFGDPETQSLLPLLKNDLFDLFKAAVKGELNETVLEIDDKFCSTVVVVAEDYPSSGQIPYSKVTGYNRLLNTPNIIINYSNIENKDCKLFCKSGRVLSLTAIADSLTLAVDKAILAASQFEFRDPTNPEKNWADYRKDIGFFAKSMDIMKNNKDVTYASAGVSVQNGNKFVKEIKSTSNLDIGGFGGLYKLSQMKNPILVSGTDGVGTKLKISQQTNHHSTIGIDLVAMCVNDILVCGAEPIFFLDYYSCGKLDIGRSLEIIK